MQRRAFIKHSTLTVISVSAFGALRRNGEAFATDTPTTTDILGPFYRPGAPLRTNLRLPGSKGIPIVLKGAILREDRRMPVNNALVEIWPAMKTKFMTTHRTLTTTAAGKQPKQTESMNSNLSCRFPIKLTPKIINAGALHIYTCGCLCPANKT